MYLIPVLDIAAAVVSLMFFIVGSISDFKKREVDDKVWLAFGPIGLILTISRVIIDPSLLLLFAASAVLTFLVAMGLFYFGLTGGADAKAIICLGITLPTPPTAWQPLLGFVHPFFPVVVVMMGFICSGSIALWFGARNIITYIGKGQRMFDGVEHEKPMRKLFAFFSGYPAEISKLESKFYLYPIEEVVTSDPGGPTEMRFKFFVDAEIDRDELVSKFKEAVSKTGFDGMVWVTPGLPMLFFILIGLLIALAIGDPLFATILRTTLH
jgi:prepilin signal peptidase PulO-like enzyme (type II secretory pathway)